MTNSHALVLIPGILCNEEVWSDQRAALSDIAVIQVPDLRGKSTLSDMAAAILDSAPPVFALAGHSMGGRVALEILDQAPARISSLALLNTGVHPVGENEPARRQASMATVAKSGLDAFVDPWLKAILPDYRLHDDDIVSAVRRMILSFSPEDFNNQTEAMLTRRDSSLLLDGIVCPTLLLCGEDDAYSPPKQHQLMQEKIPNAKLIVLEHCGHMSPMEAPEEVSAALRDWLLSS